ncbi:MAG: NgoFVII family restriction endonuclease [Peptostreptococcaceae bacterium]
MNNSCNLTLLATSPGTRNIIGIPILVRQVNATSGLNWGYSAGTPILGDAYILVNINNIIEFRNMFIKSSPLNIPIRAVWDDGTEINLLLEGNGVDLGDGNFYPKQISISGNKSISGDYLRRIGNRIGRDLVYSQYAISTLANIKSHYAGNKEAIKLVIRNNQALFEDLNDKLIRLDDLQEYGRTNIGSVDRFVQKQIYLHSTLILKIIHQIYSTNWNLFYPFKHWVIFIKLN